MNRIFLSKVLGILFLIVLMAWALSHVNSLIHERQARQMQVNDQIAQNSAGSQTILGPVLVVPYTETYSVIEQQYKTKATVIKKQENKVFLLPEDLELAGGFSNEYKYLGIYRALMYQLSGKIKGKFNLTKLNIKPENTNGTITIHDAYLSMGLSDPRGINGKPDLNWDNHPIEVAQGSRLLALGNGIHAPIGSLVLDKQSVAFELKLNMRGMEKFDFVPIANNNLVSLHANWKHPHFDGSFLPDSSTQRIDESGFKAQWSITSLASNIQEKLLLTLQSNNSNATNLETLSVGFIEPINIYSQADRATKYGLLFIGLTFAGFFVFEILKQLRIHPAQYTLVGLAMALFYLLLISLSEHISFVWSYLVASAACVSLLTYYLSHVLKNKIHGLFSGSMLTALYGALYGILASEDNALLMGSLLVFGLLALAMILTRKIDWYQINNLQNS